MPNTVKTGSNGVTIVFDGSTAWDSSSLASSGMPVGSLEFKPVATDDICAVREDASATGRKIFDEKAATAYDNKIKYFNATAESGRLYKLYVVGSEVTASCTLIIEFG